MVFLQKFEEQKYLSCIEVKHNFNACQLIRYLIFVLLPEIQSNHLDGCSASGSFTVEKSDSEEV